MDEIPGFSRHRRKYSARVLVERGVAEDVAAEAARRGVTVADVLRSRVSFHLGAVPVVTRVAAPVPALGIVAGEEE